MEQPAEGEQDASERVAEALGSEDAAAISRTSGCRRQAAATYAAFHSRWALGPALRSDIPAWHVPVRRSCSQGGGHVVPQRTTGTPVTATLRRARRSACSSSVSHDRPPSGGGRGPPPTEPDEALALTGR